MRVERALALTLVFLVMVAIVLKSSSILRERNWVRDVLVFSFMNSVLWTHRYVELYVQAFIIVVATASIIIITRVYVARGEEG